VVVLGRQGRTTTGKGARRLGRRRRTVDIHKSASPVLGGRARHNHEVSATEKVLDHRGQDFYNGYARCAVVSFSGIPHPHLLGGRADRHVSLQRLARIMAACACWIEAFLSGISPERLWEHSLAQHAFYEQRNDRKNFCELFAQLATK
jgi:hypothetical protein